MKQPPMTEDQLTEALRSLRPDTSEEAFKQLTCSDQPSNIWHRTWWYAAAAMIALVLVFAWSWNIGNRIETPSEAQTIDENLTQLVNRSVAAQDKAYEQRTMTSKIVNEHLLTIEP